MKQRIRKRYTADFETTAEPGDCRVWAWAICNCDNYDDIYYGNSIITFIQQCSKLANCDMYFHNLKFDSQFIIWFLLQAGWKVAKESKDINELEFATVINGTNNIYALELCFKKWYTGGKAKYKKVKIYDSLKKLPFTVKKIAKDFELPIQKLKLDYLAERERGHIFTKEEQEYLRNDVEIMARALHIQFEQGLTHMTIGSDALSSYRTIMGGLKSFELKFPKLNFELDEQIRRAYHGGWTYVNPLFQNQDLGPGKVYDVNSLYPWAMRYNDYPVGYPEYHTGKYEIDYVRPLYIQRFECEFKLKKGKLPTVQIKHSIFYNSTEYLVESNGPTILTMCNIDLELFFENYEVYNLSYICNWSFKSESGLFNDYIDHWSSVKEHSTGAKRQIAKLMLNNLYGKFATNPGIIEKKPRLVDGVVEYYTDRSYNKDAIYIPVGIFCTAYAREKTIRTAQKIIDRFVYADTDSLHIVGEDEPKELEGLVQDTKLGYWKNESNFVRARFLKAKTYVEEEEISKEKFDKSESKLDYEREGKYYHLNVKCAGMNDSIKEKVTYDNFKAGFTETGKLLPKNVRGGVVLVETEFTIKDFSLNKIVV